jgi:DNA-binding winged helix-turn-helix (wHTH) protein/TolB-like protein/tetratricopeptide (TPR) repeat protein
MLALPSTVLQFDTFRLDLAHCILLKGDEELALRQQSFDVLRHLAERQGEVVSRDELIKAVWTVEPARPEDSVAQCIKEIRRALGDDARRIVRTVPGRGYQFMAEVAAVEAAPSAPPAGVQARTGSDLTADAPVDAARSPHDRAPLLWSRTLVTVGALIVVAAAAAWPMRERLRSEPPAVLAMMPVPTLAVLPFETPDNDAAVHKEARAFSDNIAHEVVRNNVGSFLSLKAADRYGGETADAGAIGRRLGARYLLFGGLRREGAGHAGGVRLVEAESGHELWAKSFRYASAERNLPAVHIAGGINWRLVNTESQRPLPPQPEAGHYAILAFAALGSYQKAAALKEALAFSEKALALNPDWVPALQTYIWAQTSLSREDPPDVRSTRLDKAQEAAERAIKLTPLDAVVYHRYGQVLAARPDPAGALGANQIAIRLNPSLAIAHAEVGRHKIDVGLAHESVAHIREAIRLSPSHRWLSLWCLWAGQASAHAGNYHDAAQWLQKGMHVHFPHWALKPWLAVANAGLGREQEGRDLLAQYAREGRYLTIAGWRKNNPHGRGVVAEQRERIEDLLRRLGVPEGEVAASSAP